MLNLLSAGFVRLRKSRLFWLFIIGEAAWGTLVAWLLYRFGNIRENQNICLFMPMIYGCVIEAVFCGFFIGTDYSDGTVRNKISVGCGRADIYLSNLVICCFAGLAVMLMHMAVYSLIALILVGAEVFPQMLLLKLLSAVCTALSGAALFTAVSMLISKIATAVTANIFIALGSILSGMFVYISYREPEFLKNGEANPGYVGGAARVILSYFKAILPTSTALDVMSGHLPSEYLRVILCSLSSAAAFTLIGLFTFRRKNIS